MKINYVKINPGGNITAIVLTEIKNENIIQISKEILEKDNEIEQVGFIQKPKFFKEANARLQMMGGEFCGNATRCVAWYFYNQGIGIKKSKKTVIKLEISGSHKILEAIIDEDNNVNLEMPIKEEPGCIQEKIIDNISIDIVELDGITHAIIDKKNMQEINKEKAKELLKKLNLLNNEASGIIIYEKIGENKFRINPFVWVKDTSTLYNETGCASGTIALAQAQAKRNNSSLKILVIQPSEAELTASVIFENNKFFKAEIGGKVNIINEFEKEILI